MRTDRGPSAPDVVIFSFADDSHSREVDKKLQLTGRDSTVLVWEEFGNEWLASWRDREQTFEIELANRSFSLTDIGSYWLRRDPVMPDSGSNDPVQQYLGSQQVIFQRWMLHWLADVRPGVDPLAAVITAGAKPRQQTIATRRGLAIPATYSGNSPSVATSWMNSTTGDLCIKAIEAGRIRLDDGQHIAHYTSMFARRPPDEMSSLRDCPVTLQAFIPKAYEIRVTAIGNDLFSCAIDTSAATDEARVDWRHYDWANTPYRRIELPSEVADRLRLVLRDLGLQYGAFDLIVTPSGDYIFLEVNPSGQFLWIEDLTDLPITSAIAQHLGLLCQQ